jgi:hypothetical protein
MKVDTLPLVLDWLLTGQCDGARPNCSRCQAREVPCFYRAEPDTTPAVALNRVNERLQRRLQAMKNVLDILSSCSESKARAVLRLIRNGHDPAFIVSLVMEDSAQVQRATVTPETVHNILPPLRFLAGAELSL